MKKLVVAMLMVCLCVFAVNINAFAMAPSQSDEPAPMLTGYCGDTSNGAEGKNASYKMLDENQDGAYDTLRITGTGKMGKLQEVLEKPTSSDRYFYYRHPVRIDVAYVDGVTNVDGFEDSGAKKVVLADTVTTISKKAFYSADTMEIVLPKNLKVIEEYAFALTNFESFTIPDTVTEIGTDAFYANDDLKELHIGKGVKTIGNLAFDRCAGLEEVVIPGNVKTIGDNVFSNCTSLKSVVFNYGVETIGSDVFSYCTSLENVTIPNSVTSIGRLLYGSNKVKELYIPGSIKNIKSIVYKADYLENITFGEGVENITVPVSYCENLVEVNLPSTVNEMSDSCDFIGCPKLKTVGPDSGYNINYGWKDKIIDFAFKNCTSIESVKIRSGITKIGLSAFSGCNNLKRVDVSSSVKNIGGSAFINCYMLSSFNIGSNSKLTAIGDSSFKNCESITKLSLPEGLLTIGNYAFEGAFELKDIYIPSTITNIGERIFAGCVELTSVGPADDGVNYCIKLGKMKEIPARLCQYNIYLQAVVIPEGVIKIGSAAFSSCEKLKYVNMPNSVKELDYSCFYNCSSLREINISNKMEYIRGSAFGGCGQIRKLSLPSTLREFSGVPSNPNLVIEGYNNSPSDYSNKSGYKYVSKGKCCRIYFSSAYYYDEFKVDSIYVVCNTKIGTLPTPPKPKNGYVFQCWSDGDKIKYTKDTVAPNKDYLYMYTNWYINGLPQFETSENLPRPIGSIIRIGNDEYKVTKAAKNSTCEVTLQRTYRRDMTSKTLKSTVTYKNNKYKVVGIESDVFLYCTSLKSVVIPSTIKKIGEKAFYGCGKLTKITINTTSLNSKNVYANAFGGLAPKCKIYVPGSKYNDYVKLLKSKGFKGKYQRVLKK